MKHIPLKTISLKQHPKFTERWLQDVIAADPKILGIGDVLLKDKERIQNSAGRLDLLLQDAEGHGRYEVEIQLGNTDESHLIRTIEYWDIERKRYPQYDHTAVIIAENITSRFLNVISLFNGFIPLMALQVTAIETPEGIGLHFTKVLDTVRLGLIDEDETVAEAADRAYWDNKATKQTVGLADKVLELIKEHVVSEDVKAELSYNKPYIGLWVEGRPCNFAIMRPQKKGMRLEIKLPKTIEVDEIIENSGFDFLDYDSRWQNYRIKLEQDDLKNHGSVIAGLLKQAYEFRT